MEIFAAVSLITILVFIHEFGHFVVAKACGVAVPVFSIGFGRRIVGFQFRGTDYRLSLLPFGGYVRMAGADPFGLGDEDDEELDDPSQAFLRRPVWQRLLVVAAGPVFNLALPFVVFTVLLMLGEPQPAAVVGGLGSGSVAEQTGVLPGDTITAVDGVPVGSWVEMVDVLATMSPGAHSVEVLRNERSLTLGFATADENKAGPFGITSLRPSNEVGVDDSKSPAGVAGIESGDRILSVGEIQVTDWIGLERVLSAATAQGQRQLELVIRRVQGDQQTVSLTRDDTWIPVAGELSRPAEAWGLLPATIFVGQTTTTPTDNEGVLAGCRRVAEVPSSPAIDAGIQDGDRFLRISGQSIVRWDDVLRGVGDSMVGKGETADAKPILLDLVRDGALIQLEITPEVVRDTDGFGRYYYRPLLGVARLGTYVEGPTVRKYYGFGDAFSRASDETTALAGYIIEQIGKLLTGEAAMKKSIGGPVEMVRQAKSAAEKGIFAWARLMGMLSISLGIINLLPVPVLDGGQFLFYAVEGIRGRPLSLVMRERAQQVGVLLLVLLMMSVSVFDIQRLFE